MVVDFCCCCSDCEFIGVKRLINLKVLKAAQIKKRTKEKINKIKVESNDQKEILIKVHPSHKHSINKFKKKLLIKVLLFLLLLFYLSFIVVVVVVYLLSASELTQWVQVWLLGGWFKFCFQKMKNNWWWCQCASTIMSSASHDRNHDTPRVTWLCCSRRFLTFNTTMNTQTGCPSL